MAVAGNLQKLLLSFALLLAGGLSAQDIETLLEEGKANAGRRAFKAALVPLDAAVKLDPKNVEARRWRGHCRNALGMHADALLDYDEAIRLSPEHAWSWYARGMAKHHLNRFQAAIADYTQALKLDPNHFKAVEWRGFNKAILGDDLGAYVDLKRAEELDPKNPWVYMTRGRVLLNLGDLRRARQDFLTTLKLQPKHVEAHAQLGFLQVATGDKKAALASFDAAFQLDPKADDNVRLWRYWLQASTGKARKNARKELPTEGWPGDLARVLLGDVTPEQLAQRLAAQKGNRDELSRRRCEAAFHLGLRALLVGQEETARKHLGKAVVVGNRTMPEWRAARYLTRR